MGNCESAPLEPRIWYWGEDGHQYRSSDHSLMPINKYVLPPGEIPESPPAPGFQSENGEEGRKKRQ